MGGLGTVLYRSVAKRFSTLFLAAAGGAFFFEINRFLLIFQFYEVENRMWWSITVMVSHHREMSF
ncbi:unnamed protein product [Enterobius vermicularis]|uniref:Dolichyl-diphosphooligosaccharide--protein glycotransferase n=1 Tax=Enterobius vermicularis TaxID=51028 RepID=A0A158QA22_ENTVE|nr:unnamed protein product [Enterobius vermicularis]